MKRVVYRLNPQQSDYGDHSKTQTTPPCTSTPLQSSKLINPGLPSCQILPLASIPLSENLATILPGSSLPNKQTNCPATVRVPYPGAARQHCAPPLPQPLTHSSPSSPGRGASTRPDRWSFRSLPLSSLPYPPVPSWTTLLSASREPHLLPLILWWPTGREIYQEGPG